MFNSPMSNSSSCTSSPFSSPETGAELDFLDMPMPMFYSNDTSIYQQIFDMDGSNEPVQHHQQQQQQQYQPYQSYPSPQLQKQHQQHFQYSLAQIGLGTPPTSPPAPTFYKYAGVNETGTMFYGSQPQVIHNAYVTPTQPLSVLQQNLLPLQEAVSQQQLLPDQLAYHLLMMQQFDNPESSVSSSSPTLSSISSSLSSSPFAESPLMAINADFDLFPKQNTAVHHATTGFPTAPVLAPSVAAQSSFAQSGVFNQLNEVMQEATSLFNGDINAGSNVQQPLTTELSLLCKCPGKFPCGEQLADGSIESSSCSSSSLHDIRENESSESDSGSEEEQQDEEEDGREPDPTYVPSRRRTSKGRPKSMTISTSSAPYSSPYSKDSSSSPSTPVRQDRRRSSSGSYSSVGHSHNQQLLDPDMVPEIKDIHVCPVCQRRFTRPFNLRSHLMTHTTARPFPCDECHWKFTRQHDLLRHKRAKHPNSVGATSAGQKKDTQSSAA
ncbi:hypothetical protein BGZ80_008520 [Entomortierella chlamydospora]|uniref:C2H2-type domain-containing protein n=2 Tax=Mortierellaceae TaxID=4854 RepID=A0A9P6MYN3_9FUNG|nr:hypothetical protein BGZ79_009024 [Entomortierella chlamydospora]KAG0017217.1 hypothetical protein BGZ80_008520 [Entomortierella chlamydospora]